MLRDTRKTEVKVKNRWDRRDIEKEFRCGISEGKWK